MSPISNTILKLHDTLVKFIYLFISFIILVSFKALFIETNYNLRTSDFVIPRYNTLNYGKLSIREAYLLV